MTYRHVVKMFRYKSAFVGSWELSSDTFPSLVIAEAEDVTVF